MAETIVNQTGQTKQLRRKFLEENYNLALSLSIQKWKPNIEITIKANTPIISILPIDLSGLQNSEIVFEDISKMPQSTIDSSEYGNLVYEINRSGKWTNFYRDAVDHKGQSLGKHETKALRLKVIDGPQACGIE